jgi:hypothetical protein
MPPFVHTLELTCTRSSESLENLLVENLQKPGILDHPPAGSRSKKSRTILQKKAWAKYKTVESILELIELHSEFENKYWDTFHCCEVLEEEGQYITGHYCGNRWCRICGRIVTAKLIQAYKPVLVKFQDPQFVTLTIVNITEHELAAAIKKMIRTFNTINHKFRQNRPYRIYGIRKIEVEPSIHPGEYHPHLHVILDGNCVAQALIQEWLLYYPTADIRGQNITKCDSGSLTEFFKYTTKPVVKTKPGGPPEKNHTAYQLDIIYRSLDKKRIFQPIGIKKSSVKETCEGIRAQKIPELKHFNFERCSLWIWNQTAKDWISIAGDHLSNYKMNKEIPGFVGIPGYNRRN